MRALRADAIDRKIPQVGNVVIGDDVEIGANVTVDRATFGSTVIGRINGLTTFKGPSLKQGKWRNLWSKENR